MAPTSSKNFYFNCKDVRLLVANKNVMETEKSWSKLEYPVFKGTDGIFFIDDSDCFAEVLTKMTAICRKPVARIYYVDSDNDELPIDSELEFKEALKLIGARTDKGKFTSMRIETSDFPRNPQKKVKKPKVKVPKIVAKVNEPLLLNKILKKGAHEPKYQKNTVQNDSSAKNKFGISQTWLENFLKQFKLDLMAELEKLLDPYVAEQKKMSALISSLSASCIAEKAAVEKVSINIKKLSESDHNYSASAKKALGHNTAEKKQGESIPNSLQVYENVPFEDDGDLDDNEPCPQCMAQCVCPYTDEDDNISMYSGEISVTESESDVEEAAESFVDVPLPSCFNAVAPQGVSTLIKSEKDLKPTKAEPKGKAGKNSKSDRPTKIQEESQPQQRANMGSSSTPSNKKAESKKETVKKPSVDTKQENLPGNNAPQEFIHPDNDKDTNCGSGSCHNKENDSQYAKNEEYDEVDEDYVDDTGDDGDDSNNVNEEGQEDDDDYNKDFDDGFVEDISIKDKQMPPPSDTYQQMPLDHSGKNAQLSEPMPKQQIWAPSVGHYQQHDNLAMDRMHQKIALIRDDLQPAQQYAPQYSMHGTAAYANPQMVSSVSTRLPVCGSQSRQGAQPMLVLTSTAVPGSVSYMQMPDTPTMQKPFQPTQPIIKMQQPVTKPSVLLSTRRLIETAHAALQTQHQQIVQAAQRAAHQAQQTQALCLSPQNHPSTQSIEQDDNSDPTNETKGENRKPHSSSTAAMPRQMVEAAQELKLWNEVDQVDLELRKWVLMCQQLMESIPRRVDDSSLAMPESLRKMATTAVKTHQELEKVYQNFCKDVQLVSAHIDMQKQQKLIKPIQNVNDDPIVILPEKLMQVISATLNTTFNILANISKLGMASSSVPSEKSNLPSAPAPAPAPAPAMEKLQPKVSASISPIGNARFGYGAQSVPYAYYYPYGSTLANDSQNTSACGIVTDTSGTQDAGIAYRMRPVGNASSLGPNYPIVWGQNISTYTTAQTLGQLQTQAAMLTQQQSQQSQLTQPMQRQIPQQMQSQLQQSIQTQQMLPIQSQLQSMQPLQQQVLQPMQSQMQPQIQQSLQPIQPLMQQPLQSLQTMQSQMQIPRDDGRQMNPESTYMMQDYSPDAHNSTGISVFYPNLKPSHAGFCSKTYGGMKN